MIGDGARALRRPTRSIATTGFRPDLSLLGELRLDLDDRVEAPRALAPLIDPNVHSCGTVPPHGDDELAHPEPGFYVVGMKSYGRAPTFLLLTGYEQVRSVVAALAGDWQAARKVDSSCRRPASARPIRPAPPSRAAAAACCGAGSPHEEGAATRVSAAAARARAARRPSATRALSRAWAIVGALSVTETVSWGILYYAFAVFLAADAARARLLDRRSSPAPSRSPC